MILGQQLRQWLTAADLSQAELARALHVDPAQVSRWCSDRAMPRDDHVAHIVEVLRGRGVQVELSQAGIRVFFSTPMAALDAESYEADRAAAQTVYEALSRIASPVYWGAAQITSADQFEAPDLAAERNLTALSVAEAFVYLQLRELTRPSSSYVEVGMAIASGKAVTLFAPSEECLPYILRRFEPISGRAAGLGGRFRFYSIRSAADVVRLLAIHGAMLVGLAEVEAAEPAGT